MRKTRYRIGLDLGTNSIGWAMFLLNEETPPKPIKLIRLGSRIFSDGRNPKDGESLAVQRRGPRQHRRRRDRYLQRRQKLINALIYHGLLPKDEVERRKLVDLNPYELRKQGLDSKLPLHHLGRALFHLNQRRGFKSNRKTDRKADDSGKIKSAIKTFKESLGSARSVGEALCERLTKGESVRARLVGDGAKASYVLYIDRSMVESEFDALWKAQAKHYPELLTESVRAQLRDTMFYQRDLKPVEPGKCFLEPDDKRAPSALPSSQLFRLYQEVNHLRLITKADKSERALTQSERDELADFLAKKAKVEFDGLRKHLFRSNQDAFEFTIETPKRKYLLGNDTAYKLANKKAFGGRWHEFSLSEQDAIVERLLETESEKEIIGWRQTKYKLGAEAAAYVSGAGLADGHMRLGRRAIGKVLSALIEGWDSERSQPLTYDKAVRVSYPSHKTEYDGEIRDSLPYYGEILWRYTMSAQTAGDAKEREFGRIANPTVHIGLNQVRVVLNTIIKKYGHPSEIVVELARELKQNREQKRETERRQKEAQDINDDVRTELAKLNVKDTTENRLRFKLYKELGALDRRCVYTGKSIELPKLFTNEYQIDHILPFAQTLDDGYGNKLLVRREANQVKGNQSPFGAFGHSPGGFDWHAIRDRAQRLPREKFKRFDEKSLENWLQGQEFLARQLTDTAYLARVAKEYLSAICPPNRIHVTPGRLTALLRGKWGLNHLLSDSGLKNRTDQRHHAVDACVIAATDRSLLAEVARVAGRAKEQDLDRLFGDFPFPWPTFRHEIEKNINGCVISYKPDHGPQGALHEETAYGVMDGPNDKGVYSAFIRVALTSLKDESALEDVVGDDLRALLQEKLRAAKDFKARLAEVAAELNIRRVRLARKISGVTVPLSGSAVNETALRKRAVPVKLYKGGSNYCYEIYRSETRKWSGDIITTFQAHQAKYRQFMKDAIAYRHQAFCERPLVMRLMIDDLVAVERAEGVRTVMRVVKLSEGKVVLADHFEGGSLKERDADKNDSFKYVTKSPGALVGLRARRVFVDPLGFVLDSGFKV